MVSSGRLLNKIAEVNMDFPVEKLFGGTIRYRRGEQNKDGAQAN